MLRFLHFFLTGIIIGVANAIPGVSGGTMAVVFGIYDQFVNAVTLNVKKLWANRAFVLPILCGMAVGILIFSKAITFLYENFPFQTDLFFVALILGSMPLIFRLAQESKGEKDFFEEQNSKKIFKKRFFMILCAILGFLLVFAFSILQKKFGGEEVSAGELPNLSIFLALKLFFSGILGAFAMVIPGISGSLLMLILGSYQIVISAVASLTERTEFFSSVMILLPTALGILVGLLFGAKLVAILLRRVPGLSYACIFGLLIASVLNVLPDFKIQKSFWLIFSSILCVFAGFSLAFFPSRKKRT